MKRIFYLFLFLFSFSIFSQEKFEKDSVLVFQKGMNEHYQDSIKSPLQKKDLKDFHGLDFYVPNEKYFVVAKFIKSKKEKPFEMKTTTDRKPVYVKYGEVHFEIDGKKLQLNVYRNIAFSKNKEYKNHLFLPFTDDTCGIDSYGGGRYIDLKIPKGNQIVIDFNKAYNPYCAYNPSYSCPIVPSENNLEIEVLAGVKKFHD